MRRRTLGSKKLVDKEIRFTSSTSWTIPAGCKSIDIFLVGGGGAGGNWVTWGYTPGGPGSGGGTNTVKNISVISGQSVSISIGAGGSSVSSDGSDAPGITDNNGVYHQPGTKYGGGKGQGYTTRDFGEPTGKRNAGGGGADRNRDNGNGGESDYDEGCGTGQGTRKSGGYGGGGCGSYGTGGDGTVLIRYYAYKE